MLYETNRYQLNLGVIPFDVKETFRPSWHEVFYNDNLRIYLDKHQAIELLFNKCFDILTNGIDLGANKLEYFTDDRWDYIFVMCISDSFYPEFSDEEYFKIVKTAKRMFNRIKIKPNQKTKKRKPLPKGLRHEVFKRDGFKCQECGVYKPDEGLEASHIIASAKGGTDELDNLKTLCKTCNRQQGDLNW